MLCIFLSGVKTSAKGPAIFIDRDGVINCRRPGDYVLDWSQFIFMSGIRAALKRLASLELPMIVISNQAGVGKGLLDTAGLEEITARMHKALLADGTRLAAAYYCTHLSEEHCSCRKPKPELLRRAAENFHIDLSRSIFIGDSDTDMKAGMAAGCKPVLFGSDPDALSGSNGSAAGLSISPTANELFDVVVECLRGRG